MLKQLLVTGLVLGGAFTYSSEIFADSVKQSDPSKILSINQERERFDGVIPDSADYTEWFNVTKLKEWQYLFFNKTLPGDVTNRITPDSNKVHGFVNNDLDMTTLFLINNKTHEKITPKIIIFGTNLKQIEFNTSNFFNTDTTYSYGYYNSAEQKDKIIATYSVYDK